MQNRKLSKREASLVSHARRRAIRDYEEQQEITVSVEGQPLVKMNLLSLRMLNESQGEPSLTVRL